MRRGLAAGVGIGAVLAVALLSLRLLDRRRTEQQSHTIVEAVRRVTRLATVEMSLGNWQLRRDARDLFGFIPISCEKTIAVFYRGKITAGFDLDPPGALGLTVAGRRVQVHLPAPRILSTDMPPPDLVVADGSVCNPVSTDDYVRLHADARTALQRDALASGVLDRAEVHARQLIAEIVRPFGVEAQVTIDSPGFMRNSPAK
jgi:hypothetical protein